MAHTKEVRQALKRLSPKAVHMFEAIESRKLGESRALPELCRALDAGPTFIAYACLAGDGTTQQLSNTVGFLSSGKKRKAMHDFLTAIRHAGADPKIVVVFDDFEPCRAWQWDYAQEEVTLWCEILIDEHLRDVFPGFDTEVLLCSQLESNFEPGYADVYRRICNDRAHDLLIHQNFEHMRRFPNKKRTGDERECARRKVAQYAVQGLALERRFPNGILLQSETPWRVKDPLYDPLRQAPMPVVHLFPDERR
jgi:hypothetical protein